MAGYVDTRSSKGFSPLRMQLNKGLDLSGNPLQREPGSLRESLNVSVQDGVLQTAATPVAIGRGDACDIPWGDIWMLEGQTTSVTGSWSGMKPYKVEWYYGTSYGRYDQTRFAVAGTGYLWSGAGLGFGGGDFWMITHTKGLPPDGADYFKRADSSETMTITDNSRFTNIEYPNDSLTGSVSYISETAIRNALWNMVVRGGTSALPVYSSGSGADVTYQGVPGINGISHVFGHSTAIYAVRDWPVIWLENTTEQIFPYSAIEITNGVNTYYATAIRHEHHEHFNADGYSWVDDALNTRLYLGPDATNNGITDINNLFDLLDDDTTGYYVQYPGGAYSLGDLYAVVHPRNTHYNGHGLMFKVNTADDGIGEQFTWVPLGYSLKFDAGVVDPHVDDGPLIPSDSLPYLQDSGWVDVSDVDEKGSLGGTFPMHDRNTWTGLANAEAEDGVFATCGPMGATADGPLALAGTATRIDQFNANSNAKLVGIEVRIKCKSTGAATMLNEVRLVSIGGNDHGGYTLTPAVGNSQNRAVGDTLSATNTWYTFGGQTDTWGLTNLDFFDTSRYDLRAIFRFDDLSGASPTVSVDSIQFRFHFLQDRARLYLYDTINSADAAELDVLGLQVHDGDWSTDDATGWMAISSIEPVTTVGDIWDYPFRTGMQIRTESAGGGTLIADAVELTPNVLPSGDAISSMNTRPNMRVGVVSDQQAKERVYVANGAGPAFAVDQKDRFQFIRLPVDPMQDKPRQVELIPGHLLLSTQEHLFISSIGNFNNFSTFDGATVWSLNDKINGMQRMPDNTVILGCSRSVQRLAGSAASGSDPFNIRHVSSARGTLANSMVLADDLYMMSENGITGLAASDKFGDFEGGVLSAHVEPYLRPRLSKRRASLSNQTVPKTGATTPYTTNESTGDFNARGFIMALPMRRTNQILYFFADADILVATLPGANAPNQQRIEYTVHNYSANVGNYSSTFEKHFVYPTDELAHRASAGCSFVTNEGKEWVVVGTYGGEVIRMGEGAHTCNFNYFSTNPVAADPSMEGTIQVESCSVLAEHLLHHKTRIEQQPDAVPPIWQSSGFFSGTDRSNIVYNYPTGAIAAQFEWCFGEWQLQPLTLYQPATSSAFSWAVGTYNSGTQERAYFPVKYHMLTAKVAGRAEGKSFGQRSTHVGGAKTLQKYYY